MKIYEVITEMRRPKPTKRQVQSSKGMNIYGDKEKSDSTYVAFKLGQAMACTDGKSKPDIDAKSWYGKKKTIYPYTKEEQDMFIQAAKAVGAAYTDLHHGDMRSLELDSTHKVSPVAKIKTNKYGV